MQGISSKALGGMDNKYKYNKGSELQSKEFSDGSGLEIYDSKFRSLDPQIGRFLQIDPLADVSNRFSPYAYASNNPLFYNDPFGLISTPDNPQVLQAIIVTPNNKRGNFGGFHWPGYSRHDAKVYDRAKALYTQRRDAGRPLIQGGESKYFMQNQKNLERFYTAEQQGRQLQVGALLGIFAPVAATAIAPYAGVISGKVTAEAGLLRIGTQMAGRQYGRTLIGSALMNGIQNGGNLRNLDAVDIATGTLNPLNGFSGAIGTAAINSLFDYNIIQNSSRVNSPLWGGKNWIQTGLDFSFSSFGEGAKSTLSLLGVNNGINDLFIDVVTGNRVTQAQNMVEK